MQSIQRIVFLICLFPSVLAVADEAKDKPVSGVYFAEKIEASPHFVAAGMAWWNDRLIIANREPPALHAFTPPDKFEVFKELTRPVGLAVDAENRLVFTEKEDKVLYRLVRLSADGEVEDLVKEEGIDNKQPGEKSVGTPQFVAVHPNGTIYWSGFPGAARDTCSLERRKSAWPRQALCIPMASA